METKRKIDIYKLIVDFRNQLVQNHLVTTADCLDCALEAQGFKCMNGMLVYDACDDVDEIGEDIGKDMIEAVQDCDDNISGDVPRECENSTDEETDECDSEPLAHPLFFGECKLSMRDAKPGDVIECVLNNGQVLLVMFAGIENIKKPVLVAQCGIFYGVFVDSYFGNFAACGLNEAKFRIASGLQRSVLLDEIKNHGLYFDSKTGKLENRKSFRRLFDSGSFIISFDKSHIIAKVLWPYVDGYGTERYEIEFADGTTSNLMCEFVEDSYREWNINDVVPGDVLVYETVTSCDDHVDVDKYIFVVTGLRDEKIVGYGMRFFNGHEMSKGETDGNAYCADMTEYVFQQIYERHYHVKPATKKDCDLLFSRASKYGCEFDKNENRFMHSSIPEDIEAGHWVINKRTGVAGFVDSIRGAALEDKSYAEVEYTDGSEAYIEYKEFIREFMLWDISYARENDILRYDDDSKNLVVMFGYFAGVNFLNESFVSKCAIEITGTSTAISFGDFHIDAQKFIPVDDETKRDFIRKLSDNGYELKGNPVTIVRHDYGVSSRKNKFNEGDWIVYEEYDKPESRLVLKVAGCSDGMYKFSDGMKISRDYEHYMRKWTYADARDGDVLVSMRNNRPFILKGRIDVDDDEAIVSSYCGIYPDGSFATGSDGWSNVLCSSFEPASEEAKRKLFEQMEKAGYCWDDKSNELVENHNETLSDSDECNEEDVDEQDISVSNLFGQMKKCYKNFIFAADAFVNELKNKKYDANGRD